MPRIVIVGAGPAGINLAQGLAKQLTAADNTQVLVLEKSKFFYHAVGVPRAYVEPGFAPKLFVPYDNVIPKEASSFVKIQRAVVTRIVPDTNEVQYIDIGPDDSETGPVKSVRFDYLVLATGSTYISPVNQPKDSLKRSDTEAKLLEVSQEIAKASKILVVGGGAVGCEVAGEIKSKYPKKTVTLLDAKSQLVSGSNVREKFRTKLKSSMEKLDIELVLGERLEERLTDNVFVKRTLRTDKGTEIESDIQLLCVGFTPTADLVADFDHVLVTAQGAIRVNDQLQLDDARYHHVFALGDSSNHSTPKVAYWAGEQGKFLATQLAAVLRKKQTSFAAFPEVKVGTMLLPLGPNGGVSQLPLFGGMVMGDMTTRAIKSKDYFASMTWQSLNATVPE